MTLTLPIYLDHHATTPVDARVLEAMLPYFDQKFGNSGSVSHSFGWDARDAVAEARSQIAAAIGASEREIVFTSGATESNNLAIRGLAERTRRKGNHLLSVATEHRAVLDPLAKLGRRGFDVTLLGVHPFTDERAGIVEPQDVAGAIREDTLLVSVMLANNEIGAIHPIAEIGAICKQRGVVFHCDATQAAGKIPIDVEQLQVDLLSFSAHKIYGPKGIGGLYVRRRSPSVKLEPQIDGGGQEGGIRGGTLNVPGIVGFAAAMRLSAQEFPQEAERTQALRDRLWEKMQCRIPDVDCNGPVLSRPEWRLANNLNVRFAGVEGEALMMSMREIAVSSGSACTSANPEPSHVLRAIGLSEDSTRGSLRFGLGRFNTVEEIDYAANQLAETVERLRRLGRRA